MPRLAVAVGLFVLMGGLVTRAQASPPFELVGSALGEGGLSARAAGADAASAYFNPARLSHADQGLQLGLFVVNDGIDVTLYARSPADDVPTGALNQFEDGFPAVPTGWLEQGCDPEQGGECVSRLPPRPRQSQGSSGTTHVYQVFGLVQQVVERWFTVGVYGMVPLDGFMQGRSFFVDEREQYFSNSLHPERYADRLTAMSLAFGASSQVFDWLSIGLGVTLNLTNAADAGTYVGNSDRLADTLLLNTDVSVSTGVAPHFGIAATPVEGLSINATAHAPEKLEIVTGFSTYLPNGDLQRAERTATLAWQPWMLSLGAQYDFIHGGAHRLGVVATATDEVWSQYRNRHNERPQQGYAWANVLSLTGGLRYGYTEAFGAFLDVAYVPSPVPDQTGRTNYVDNDRYVLGAGVTTQFELGDSGLGLRLGVQGQVHVLPTRSQRKLDPTAAPYAGAHYPQLVQDEWVDGAVNSRGEVLEDSNGLQTNNPGWPGYSSKGMILGGGVHVSLLY